MRIHYKNKRNDLMSPKEFQELLDQIDYYYKPIIEFLYFSGVRVSEALALTRDNFTVTTHGILVDGIYRLKHSKQTEALTIPSTDLLLWSLNQTREKALVFPFTRETVRNVLKPFGLYPHYFRMNRISQLFMQGKTIVEVQSWTGLSVNALNAYIGKVSNMKVGKELT